MSIQLNIGANIDSGIDGIKAVNAELRKMPAATKDAASGFNSAKDVINDFAKQGKLSIGVIEKSMQDLRTIIKSTAAGSADLDKLKDAYKQLQLQLAALKNESGLTSQLGGISRATRTAHSDLEQISQSIRGFANGSERGADALSNLVFTFERLSGQTGGIKPALAALGETLIGPAGLVLAITTLLPLIESFIKDLFDSGDAFDDATISAANFKNELKSIDEFIKGFKGEIDFSTEMEKLKNQLTLGRGFKADILGDAIDIKGAQKKFDTFTGVLDDLFNQINAKLGSASIVLGKSGKKLFDSFNQTVELIPQDLIDKLDKGDKRFLSELKGLSEEAAKINEQRGELQNFIEKKNLEKQISAHEEQLKEQKDAQAKLQKQIEDENRKLIALAKDIVPLFEVRPELNFFKLDTAKQELDKALKILAGVRTLTIPLKVNPKFDFKGKEIEPPKIEDLPIDLGSIGINLKGQEKFDNRLQEGISKGIIETIKSVDVSGIILDAFGTGAGVVIPIKTELKNVPSTEQEKSLVELTKQFAIFGDVGRRALSRINFKDPAEQIKHMQSALLDLTIQFNDLKIISEGIGQAFGDAFLALTKNENPIKAFFKSIINALEQLIAKLIATKIAAALLNAFLPGSSFGLKALGLVIPGRAEGGPVEGGQLHVVGERGPELFVPKVAGTIIPNHQLKSFAENNFATTKNLSSAINKSSFSDISKTVNNFYHSNATTVNNISDSAKSFSQILNQKSLSNPVSNVSSIINKSSFNNENNLSNIINSFSRNIPHLQSGGITTSDTIAQLHKAEVIMPLDRLQGMLGNSRTENNVNVGGEFVLRGEDLALTLDRFSRRKGRSF